jgi:ABC-type sugar transport system ATPase subunit
MKSIHFNQVTKSYGTSEVIKPLDLSIEAGAFAVFVGPSGCGKSTLLRMLAGLEPVTSGQIMIGDRNVTALPPVEREVAMVFQSYALYPHMTVGENIAFGLKIAGMPKAERRAKALEAARLLKMEQLFDRRPKDLSGGQRQRVAIGRAIVKQPSLFLFDEPLSNLDAELRVQMRLEIGRLHRELGATMVYVTHDQVEAMTMADTIVVLRGGQVEQVGSPMDLYHEPRNEFVAGFIGSPKMNFLPGKVVSAGDEGLTVMLEDFANAHITVPPARLKIGAQPGEPIKLGVRPEHFTAGVGGPLSVQIISAEALGNVSYLYAEARPGGTLLCIESRGHGMRDGDHLALAINPATTIVLGADGLRR